MEDFRAYDYMCILEIKLLIIDSLIIQLFE